MSVKIIIFASAAVVLLIVIIFSLTRPSKFEHLSNTEPFVSDNAFPARLLGRSGKLGPDGGLLLAQKMPINTSNQIFESPSKEGADGTAMDRPNSSQLPGQPGAIPEPEGVELPWAWIERLDSVKQAAVEKAFDDAAAALRTKISEQDSIENSQIDASMELLEQDIAGRLQGILSPQEFEAYLLSLPDDALGRLGFEKSDN